MCQRINAFKLWCWRRLLRLLWTARRSNQSILSEINSEYSLEGLLLKVKLQYFGHLRWTADSLEKSLMLGKIEGRRKRGHQRMRWLDEVTNAMDMNLSTFGEMVRDKEAWHAADNGVTKSQTWLGNWTREMLHHLHYLQIQLPKWCSPGPMGTWSSSSQQLYEVARQEDFVDKKTDSDQFRTCLGQYK